MSGAVAAHAAYNGSGTQGLAVTNKIHDNDGDVMSVFWNKNDTTRQLLYGSSIVEIPSSGGSGTNNLNGPLSTIFDVNNDIDCLGNLILKVQLNGVSTSSSITAQQLTSIISRVEIQVGTQIWQTFEQTDLLAMAATELSAGSFGDFCFQTSGGVSGGQYFTNDNPTAGGFTATSNGVLAYMPLKVFTKTLGPQLENFAEQTNSGYLMAAAPHQQVKVKVYTVAGTGALASGQLELYLYGENQVMCNEEREQMKAMPMGLPKRIKMTQNANVQVSAGNTTAKIDLDHFSLYASHLIISLPTGTNKIQYDTPNISATAELLLNSSSFSGVLPMKLLRVTGSSMGLFCNNYFVEDVDQNGYDTFVFPLGSYAYGGSSVPLNRFDNIRLNLSGILVTGTPTINITCVGETTALYKGGAASLAMY